MNILKYNFKMWVLPLLLGFFIIGCDNRDGIVYPPDNITPIVMSTNPFNAETDVPLNQIIAATFSETMNSSNITTATFTLMQGTTFVSGTVGYSGKIATYTPSSNLAPNTTYTATITTGAKDIEGGALENNHVWSFTTGTTSSTYTAALSSNPAAGGTTTGSSTFNSGSSVTVTAAANPGYIFASWTEDGNDVSTDSSYTFVITENRTLVANFVLPGLTYTVILSSNPTAGGITTGNGIYNSGSSVSVNASANPGYAFFNWTEGGTEVSTDSSYTFVITEDRILVANYIISSLPYTVNLSSNPMAGGTTSGGGTFNAGSSVTVTAASNSGYTFTNWTVGGIEVSTDSSYTFVITEDITLVANFTVEGSIVDLGTVASFGGFGGTAGITNQGIFTEINGDIGTTAVSTLVTGFHDSNGDVYTETTLNIGNVTGVVNSAPPLPGTSEKFAIAQQALLDATTAYNFLAGLPGGSDPGAGELGGLVLAPGTYTSGAGSFDITSGDLTLDAQGDPNAVWVFQMASALTVGLAGQPRSIILVNGAQSKNIFWQVGSAATINSAGGGTMEGTIISMSGVSFSTAGVVALTTLNGRALSLVASVTMVNTVVNIP